MSGTKNDTTDSNLSDGAVATEATSVATAATSVASPSDPDTIYYILVEKKGKSFNIIESTNNAITYGNTAENISSIANIIFPVLVTKTNNDNNSNSNSNSFTVGTANSAVSYTLNLEAVTQEGNIGEQINATTFKTINVKINGGSSTAREQSSLENITVNNGGQKQKQQKSKRNYSKKRRSSKSKSDTLRNYFNYDHLQ
jgi:hypothetical protein